METTLDAINESEPIQQIPEPESTFSWQAILTSPTGEGNISDYYDHPLNFNYSVPMARIIRGATGILGNLNLGIVDVLVGILELILEKSKPKIKPEVDQ